MSKKDGSSALQEVIYDALSGLSDIDVYDDIPESAPMPYLHIGNCTTVSEDTKDSFADRISVFIDVYSDTIGFAKEVANTVKSLLYGTKTSNKGFNIRLLNIDEINF